MDVRECRCRSLGEPEVSEFGCGGPEVPVPGGVAPPRPNLIREQNEPCDRWLTSLVVAVKDVDCDSPGGIEGLGGSGVEGKIRVTQSGLPEADSPGADVQVSLLWSERSQARRRVTPEVASGPLGVLGDAVSWFGLEMVCAKHSDTCSEVAERNGEVDRPPRLFNQWSSGIKSENPPIPRIAPGLGGHRVQWGRVGAVARRAVPVRQSVLFAPTIELRRTWHRQEQAFRARYRPRPRLPIPSSRLLSHCALSVG